LAQAAAGPPALEVLADRLLTGLDEKVGASALVVLAGSDADAQRRAHWRDRLPDLPPEDSTVKRLRARLETVACPVCQATGVAEGSYLRWFMARSAEDDASLRNDPGESCAVHLHDVALAGHSPGADVAIDRKRAVGIARLNRFLARLPRVPVPARRGRRANGDALDQVRGDLLAAPYCAACNARDSVEQAQQALVAPALGLPAVRERFERGHGLCVRHAMQLPDGQSARVARRHAEAQLSLTAWEVGEAAHKYAWAFRHETSGPEQDAWMRARVLIDGRVTRGTAGPTGDLSTGSP
jgi:hypothetical protein